MAKSHSELDCQSMRYVENLLDEYARHPQAVSSAWKQYIPPARQSSSRNGAATRRRFTRFSLFNPPQSQSSNGAPREKHPQLHPSVLQAHVDQLIHAFRVRGHLAANLDPLGLQRASPDELNPENYGITQQHLDETCSSIAVGGPDHQTVRAVIERMRNTYCRFIGVQFMHIDDGEVRRWLFERMEATENRMSLSRDEQFRILTRLTDAVTFERFVRKKYVGAKTFSLEGAETLIPLLDLAIEKAGSQGVQGIVLGMAHRGRLNVLANIIGKSPQEIFWEFEDPNPQRHRGRGDVKYHLGYSGDWKMVSGGKVHLSLCFNPSHLEFVNPVAMGRTRAKQDRSQDLRREGHMTLLIHGDAGFTGEGVVQETLNLSELNGYRTGGTLHVIVNNQLGFTTSPAEGRSSIYASSIAKMLHIPIFHVNGEHPEAVAQVVNLALDFRERYQRDVVIDMYCYRRWGHNESDEPSFTQPVMYQTISDRESIRDCYLEHLLSLDGLTRAEADEVAAQRERYLADAFELARSKDFEPPPQALTGIWNPYIGGDEPHDDDPDTAVHSSKLSELLVKLTETPRDFHVHPKLQRSMRARQEMADGQRPLDWAAAEALALATLALEGHPVRLTGQDTIRGTFSQRHAVLYDAEDGHSYCALQHLSPTQADIEVINSPLSEAGALGFEYGYSIDRPDALVAWEAQFGDFWNTAQVIVDQFLASAEDKWQRLSGAVLLLPHGFEGQGPEHSSARLERFLNLAAEDNLQIVNPSTPAQYFHCLRRQVLRRWRKPLVILTPKSLLRHRDVVSSLAELSHGRFQRILPDALKRYGDSPERVILCSGKLYYELADTRTENNRKDVAILRIEQFYPLVDAELQKAIDAYDPDIPVYWVQEEPENMGACAYWRLRFGTQVFGHPFEVVTRPASASPATGSKASHLREQNDLIQRAFGNK